MAAGTNPNRKPLVGAMAMDDGASASPRTSRLVGWRAAAAAVVALLLLVAGLGLVVWPRVVPDGAGSSASARLPSAAPSLPGTPGRFNDGEFAFDYPTEWKVIADNDRGATGIMDILAVLGTGSWHQSCQSGAEGTMSWFSCSTDSVDVPPGGVVVKVYLSYGPAPFCHGDTHANATVGDLAVRKTVDGTVATWEIRAPGNEFDSAGNIFVEVHTGNPSELARAEGLVASFRWLSGPTGECGQGTPPTGGPGPT
ncbi:MAG: hypothetical protein ABSA21_04240 [Candidatus Limnocylindrales bacterium]